jgi:hypothetical protein
MDANQKLQLSEMIQANGTQDQTELIRSLKHSRILRTQVDNLLFVRAKYRNESAEFINNECMNECNFLFTYYTDIYNKVRKDEIDLGILNRFFDILEQIENGNFNQHEASFQVGTILKELYVDSALKKAEKLEQANYKPTDSPKKPVYNMTWSEYKSTPLKN